MHIELLKNLAAGQTGQNDILSALGIDWRLLVFQIIAFLILVLVLNRFVFPVFFRIIDQRQEAIEASNRAAVEASQQAEKAKSEVEKLLRTARKEAGEIVATAKTEAEAMVAGAEEKAKAQAARAVASAEEEIAKEVVAAKKALHNETLELIASATEKVIGKSVDAKLDKKIIEASLAEVK